MNTGKLVWIDKYFGRMFAWMLNALVRLVGKILRIDHQLEREYNTIALCKFKGLGSIIQASPLIKTLRKRYPNAELIFITTEANRSIIVEIGGIDRIITIDDRSIFRLLVSSCSFVWNCWRKRPDLYLDLEIYSNFSSILATLSLSTNRMGYYLRSSNYRMGLYTHMMFFNTKAPISEVYLQFARALGITDLDRELIHFKADQQVAYNKPNQAYFVVNINASDLRIERAWPRENFVQLIVSLLPLYPNHAVILIGSKVEQQQVELVLKQCGGPSARLVSLAGKTSISELIHVIAHADRLITNDTGPMHIGFATRTPTLALFGPCSPSQYGKHPNCIALYKNLYCSPCVHEFEVPPCKGNNECMKLITVQEVLHALELHQNSTVNLGVEEPTILYQSPNLPQPDFPVLGFVCR